jgi:mRNA interferase RelE/StbE
MPFALCGRERRPIRTGPDPTRHPGRSVRSARGVAAAVIEFLTGVLIENPLGVGKQLRGDLAGIHLARRGTYRVLYRINDVRREVVVLRIEHRRDV